MATEFTHRMRTAELEPAIDALRPAHDVLELGAGDGWQSHALSQAGFLMTAVDVDEARVGLRPAYPVTLYDGVTLPFADGSFDAIYSSNVLEHIVDFNHIQRELKRVLRPGGFAVHCVPSSVWRAWTTIGHPVYAFKSLSGILSGRDHQKKLLDAQFAKSTSPQAKMKRLLNLALVSPRHGEHGSLMSEHLLFSRSGWIKRFKESGWSVRAVEAGGVFYSGNEIWGTWLSEATRRRLARIIGSSSIVFTVTPED